MTRPRFFLDTNVLVAGSALPQLVPHSRPLLESKACEKFTNEYALKELRRVLEERLEAPPHLQNAAVDYVRQQASVVPTPSPREFSKYELVDRSDRPVVCSAVQLSATLVTEDRRLRKEAAKYVDTTSAREAWEMVKSRIVKG